MKKSLLEEIAAALVPESKRRGIKKLRVGLVGDGWLLSSMADVYMTPGCCESVSYFHPDKDVAKKNAEKLGISDAHTDPGKFIKSVDVAEVFEIPGGRNELANELLAAGIHVSLQKPFTRTLEDADDLIRTAKKSNALLRVNEYPLYYEPYKKLSELIKKMEIGEVCAIRFRSNLVGKGGWGPLPELLKEDSIFFHPAFDRFALAMEMAGDMESVVVYANGMSDEKGGQALAGFKCRQEGCFGVFDLTYAPDTAIRTTGLPCDDQVEVAGTDGIIWANHFHGKMTEEPWIEVRRGKKHYTMGISSGMETDWEHSLRASADDFLSSVSRASRPAHTIHDSRRALKFQLAVIEAAETGAMVKIQTSTAGKQQSRVGE